MSSAAPSATAPATRWAGIHRPTPREPCSSAIRAALWAVDGSDELDGRLVGVLGLGKVGGRLAAWLAQAGATVIGYDPAPAAIEGIEHADSAQDLLARELDVIAPCALGGLIDERLADTLRCRVVCGAANNPLTGKAAAARLADRGILYAPDFLANSGGLIHVDAERLGAGAGEVELGLKEAALRTRNVLTEARRTERLPVAIAEEHAWTRIEQARCAAGRRSQGGAQDLSPRGSRARSSR
jgi:leucine dehydrogenase